MKKNDILLIPAPDEMNTIFLLLFLISVWMSSCFFCFSLCAAHRYHIDYSPLLLCCARIPHRQPFAVLYGAVVVMCFCLSISFTLTSSANSAAFCYAPWFMPFWQYATTYCRFLWHALAVCIFSIYPQTAHLEACNLHSNNSIVIKPHSSKYSIAAAFLLLIDTKRKPAVWIQTFFLNCLLKQPGLPCRSLIMQRDRYFLHPLS